MPAFRVFLCVVLVAAITRSDASLAIITPSFIQKHALLQAYLFKGIKKQKVAQWVLPDDKIFSMSFLHSVTLTPVFSTYLVQDNHILQTQERFVTHGYGLPSQAHDNNFETWEEKDDTFIVHMNREVNPLIVRVSTEYKTTLIIRASAYSLHKYDGKSLLFTTEETQYNAFHKTHE